MDSDTPAFLAGSDDRVALLSSLSERSASPATLSDDLGIPRRSVQRHLSQFVERGWATKTSGTYQLTTAGDLIAEEHTSYLDTLRCLEELHSFYRHLPNKEHAPEPRWLRDADVAVATEEDPQAPMHHYLRRVRSFDCDRIQMISPVLSRLFHEEHSNLALEGVHTDLVLADELVDRAKELNPMEFNVVVSVDVLDLYRYPDAIEFGMTIGKERVLLCAYDDGQLEACVESTNSELLAWAEDLFETYRGRGERVEPPISLPFSPWNRS